jgi:hypothetical protein
MNLDLRLPMGLMFTLTGTILTSFGLATRDNKALYAPSLGIDANLWWGAVLLVFGIIMLVLGRRNQTRIFREQERARDGKEPELEQSRRPRPH